MNKNLFVSLKIEDYLAKSLDDLVNYFLQHVKMNNIDYSKSFLFIAEELCKIPVDLLEKVIRHKNFKEIISMMIEEEKFIPHRSVPIILDISLRHKYSSPTITSTILHNFFELNGSKSTVSDLLIIGSHCTENIHIKYREIIKELILIHFENLDFNKLNRLFDSRNKFAINILNEAYSDLLIKNNINVVLNLYVLSYALFPKRREGLYNILISFTNYETSKLNKYNKNLYFFIKNKILQKNNLIQFPIQRIRNFSKKIKIAICVSGQMRGFRKAYQSWHSALKLDDVDYKYFISTWDKVGGKKLTSSHIYRYFPEIIASMLSELWNVYGENKFKETFINLIKLVDVNNQLVDAKELSTKYNTNEITIEDDSILFNKNVKNTEKMCFKIEDAFEKALLSKEEFDLYIRIRPDKYLDIYKEGINWHEVLRICNQDIIFSDFEPMVRTHQNIAIGDQVLIANKNSASVVFRPYSNNYFMNKMGESSLLMNNFTAHNCISTPCIVSNIGIKRIPGVVLSDKYLLNDSPSISREQIITALEDDLKNDDLSIVQDVLNKIKENQF